VPKDGHKYEQVADNIDEVKSFFKHPNKNGETFTEIMRAGTKDVLELDAGVIVKVFSVDSYDFEQLEPKSGAPLLKPFGQRKMLEIYARDGASFLKETDKFGFSKGYWQYSYQIPAHPMWFNREEICYMMRNQRSMSAYGYAPTQAIMDIIKSLHYSTLYNKKYFEETSIPDGIIGMEGASETDIANFTNSWNQEFKGMPHKLAVLNNKVTWQPLNVSQKELEFLETQTWYYKLVISMFGLTPTELGLTDDVNRATSTTQAELARRKGIRPLLRIIEEYINSDIIPEFGYDGIEFSFIYDDPQEKMARLENWGRELDMGLKTVNEIRVEMGLEPVSWGDQPSGKSAMMGVFGQPQQNNQFGQEYEDEESETSETKPKPSKEVEIEQDNKKEEKVKKAINEDKLRMIANEEGLNPEELIEGVKVEHEHAATVEHDENKIIRIAIDHLHEKEDYYTRLREVEKGKLQDIHDALVREGYSDERAWRIANSQVNKGINDGQYYAEPSAVPLGSKGTITQPQNEQTEEKIQTKNDLIPSLTSEPKRDIQVNCPICGMSTMTMITSPDDVGRDKQFHCTNCGTTLNEQDAIDRNVIDTMFTQMEQNNSTSPVTAPKWSPKSLIKEAELQKDIDLKMTTKDYSGVDINKSATFINEYAESDEYYKILKDMMPDLSKVEIVKIIKILRDGIFNNKSIGEMARRIERVVRDINRAELISRTETIRITNEGNRQRMKDAKVEEVEWISAPEDGRLCMECKKMDGKIFNLEAIKGQIPLHPRCRCTFSEV
jgi:SPP1 gp7 family putative phage head morphogenesis protein